MIVEVSLINGEEHTFFYSDSLEELEKRIKFCEYNDFFLTEDKMRVIIKHIVTFTVKKRKTGESL